MCSSDLTGGKEEQLIFMSLEDLTSIIGETGYDVLNVVLRQIKKNLR